MEINKLDFRPFPGLASCHLQTILSAYLPRGKEPPSQRSLVALAQGDFLSCEISCSPKWKATDQTVVLVHGMGGSHASSYMVRLSRKFYLGGKKVVRVNLRGCGSGKGLSHLPYNAGNSTDVLMVLQHLKRDAPDSEIVLIGFSLGGNVVLKLAGELGEEANRWASAFVAICPPVDLARTVHRIQERSNLFYHSHYLRKIYEQAQDWNPPRVSTLYAFDDVITAPSWGYKGAEEYYRECSSIRFLPMIRQTTHILFAEDDPFICLDALQKRVLAHAVKVWTTKCGGHLGFLGKGKDFYWMDQLLLRWVEADFRILQ